MTDLMDLSLHWILVSIILLGPLYWPAWLVCKRAGLPGPLGLLIFVPGVNVIALWAFALLRWPVENRPTSAQAG